MLRKEDSKSPRTASLSRCFAAPVSVSPMVKDGFTPPPAGPELPQTGLLVTHRKPAHCVSYTIRKTLVLVVDVLFSRVN